MHENCLIEYYIAEEEKRGKRSNASSSAASLDGCNNMEADDGDREEQAIPLGEISNPSKITIFEHRTSSSRLSSRRSSIEETSTISRGEIQIRPLQDLIGEERDNDSSDCVVILDDEDTITPPSSQAGQGQLHPALLQQHTSPRRKVSSKRCSMPNNQADILLGSITQSTTPSCGEVVSPSPIIVLNESVLPDVEYDYADSGSTSAFAAINNCGPSITSSKCFLPPVVVQGEESFGCPYCEKKYKLKASCESHIKIHEGNENTCSICGTVMSRQRDLKRHMATKHKNLLEVQQSVSPSPSSSGGSHFFANLF